MSADILNVASPTKGPRSPRRVIVLFVTLCLVAFGIHYGIRHNWQESGRRGSPSTAPARAGNLFQAIEDGSTDDVERLIKLGAQVNVADADAETLLMRAASRREPTIVEQLLAAGANPNALDKSGRTAMHHALELGDASRQVVSALIAAGAAADVRDADGQTPLMLAATDSDISILRILLANGADPLGANHSGFTPLMYAVSENSDARHLVERVRLLLEHGADANAQSSDGQTALVLASRQLEKYSDPDLSTAAGALLTGANDEVRKMDLDPEMAAELQNNFTEVSRSVQESIAAARENYPVVVRILKERTNR